MGVFSGPDVSESGLVLALDAASPKNYNLTAVEVLVVAGGGGGGGRSGGGGGAGGLIYNSNFTVSPGTSLSVTVGGGGNGGSGSGAIGSDGGSSVFGSLTAIGGGGGGSDGGDGGRTGGSGGGGRYGSSGGTGTSGQGFAGGSGTSGTWKAGGGGGAGGTGVNGAGNPHKCGDGGPGLGFNISGTFTYYAGGGGGGSHNSDAGGCCDDVTARGFGGIGGGGNGGTPGGYNAGDNGTANTGGGGGGGSTISGSGGAGGNGGSGIVIVRYPGPQKAIGGTVTSVAGHTIHTFTTVGSTTFTPLVATNNSAILGLSDFSARGNFATSVNGPTFNSANGGSIVFDGTDDYIDCGLSSFQPTAITLCAWVKHTVNGDGGIIVKGDVNEATEWGLSFGYSNPWLLVGRATASNNQLTYSWSGSLLTGFHYVCYTMVNNTRASLYVDGAQVATTNTIGSIGLNAKNVLIGKWNNYAPLNGSVAQVKIYNRELTASEIQQNFNATRGRFGI